MIIQACVNEEDNKKRFCQNGALRNCLRYFLKKDNQKSILGDAHFSQEGKFFAGNKCFQAGELSSARGSAKKHSLFF